MKETFQLFADGLISEVYCGGKALILSCHLHFLSTIVDEACKKRLLTVMAKDEHRRRPTRKSGLKKTIAFLKFFVCC